MLSSKPNAKMKFKRIFSIPVLLVILLVVIIYYVTIFIFIEEWLSVQSSAGFLNALIFTFLASLCTFSFFACVLTDPGGVPSAYVPDVEENDFSDQDSRKSGVPPRKCDKCSAYKPPRAHHCRVCKRCVLRMDHHCIWINNCVGHRNYKAFVALIFYATLASIYSMIMIISCALKKDWDFVGRVPLKVVLITCGVIVVSLSFTLGTFLSWHLYLTARNMTTIEYHEGRRAAWLARKSGLSYRHPFDVGAYRNITLILGPNMLKWFWPTATSHIKSGLGFPTARDNS